MNEPDHYDVPELPSHPRTVRVEPHTGIAAWLLEPGDELVIHNESDIKIEVEAGTLSHGRVQRINELVAERDRLRVELAEAKQAICDAIRRPMGVVPASAEKYVRESEAVRWVVAWQEQGEPIRRRAFTSEAEAQAWRASVAWNPSCMTWIVGPDGESEAGE